MMLGLGDMVGHWGGQGINLEKCPKSKLQSQCIKYLDQQHYEVVVEDGKLVFRQTGSLVHRVQTISQMHTVHARGEVEEARDVLLLTVGLKERLRMCTSPPWSPARHLCRDPASRRSRLAGWLEEAWLPVQRWQQRRERCRGAPGSCFVGSGWSSSSLRRLSLPARCCWDQRTARRGVAGWCRNSSEQSIRAVQGRWRRAAYQGRCRSSGEKGRCRNSGHQGCRGAGVSTSRGGAGAPAIRGGAGTPASRGAGELRRCREAGEQGRGRGIASRGGIMGSWDLQQSGADCRTCGF